MNSYKYMEENPCIFFVEILNNLYINDKMTIISFAR